TETIHAAPAPDQQRFGKAVPRGDLPMVEFHQVLPGRSPRAGAGEGTITRALEPFGMVLLEARAPASMVDHDIEEHPRASEMRCVRQLAELIDAGGAPVELDQCGVDAGQVQTRI